MYIFFYFFLALNLIIGQNSYPIVLIHGFMGWGSDEMGGYNYWGGEKDFVYLLEKNGHTVFELSVGPVSSNWERAIECYYQIKGGAVDYGQAHSETYKIIRKPKTKTYNGLYPEWSSEKPIHIVAHSMGGQTARMLNYLLTQEFYIDEENKLKEESQLLGEVQNNMIKSITAISAPHDGTTLAGVVTKTIPFIQYFVGVAGVIGTQFYDFDLEQFSFLRNHEESWQNYLKRMRNHDAWKTKNISSWDLGLDGAKELNNYLQASPDIYYFSFVTSTTRKSEGTKKHIPVQGTSILIKTRSKLLGSLSGYWSDGTKTDSSWYENDGIVNTISMFGPSTGINGPDPIVKYEKLDLLIPGQWYWIFLSEMDHWSVIGHLGDSKRIFRAEKYFVEHASRLKMLPKY